MAGLELDGKGRILLRPVCTIHHQILASIKLAHKSVAVLGIVGPWAEVICGALV